MKTITIALTLLLLTSCTSPTKEIAGKVVPCTGIQTQTDRIGIRLECLDGGQGADINFLKGPMIINVWGSWCGPCKEEIPVFRSFYDKAAGKLQLIGVDVEEASIEDGRLFVQTHGMTWPNLFDGDGRSRAYFGMGVPVTWFIDVEGNVAYKKIGALKNEIELITLTSKYLGVKL